MRPEEQRSWLRALSLMTVGVSEFLLLPGVSAGFGYWLGQKIDFPLLSAFLFGGAGFALGTHRTIQRARWAAEKGPESERPEKESPHGK
jgi:hypothetical protein